MCIFFCLYFLSKGLFYLSLFLPMQPIPHEKHHVMDTIINSHKNSLKFISQHTF